jgi:FkbM family methyltransferase
MELLKKNDSIRRRMSSVPLGSSINVRSSSSSSSPSASRRNSSNSKSNKSSLLMVMMLILILVCVTMVITSKPTQNMNMMKETTSIPTSSKQNQEETSKKESNHDDHDVEEEDHTGGGFAKQCTRNELLKIRSHLIPEFCVEQLQKGKFYLQLCSITLATQCPKSTLWLEEYYKDLHTERILLLKDKNKNKNSKEDKTSSNPNPNSNSNSNSNTTPSPSTKSFFGISVGCNKGFDAINTLRMGTNDNEISKSDWQNAMVENDGTLYHSVCHQDSLHDGVFQTITTSSSSSMEGSGNSANSVAIGGEMHCVEPMPLTYNKLQHSATSLNYGKKGLIVTHAAISKETNENGMLFPSGGGGGDVTGGVENQGLETCQNMPGQLRKTHCITVPVLSLKDFITTKTSTTTDKDNDRIINILSIDVEGYDGDVILGASSKVLNRVEYLEFEYNWMGTWAATHLYDIITMLYEQESSMVCYWTGIDKLWRITNCWMLYYDIHSWSNIACVNTKLVPKLALKMETIFQNTISSPNHTYTGPDSKGEIVSYDYVTRRKKLSLQKGQLKENQALLSHIAMSIDEDKLSMKYLP